MAHRPAMNLESLATLNNDMLKGEWARCHGAPAPNLSPELLRLGIGYKLQEQQLGGLDRTTRGILRQLGVRVSAADSSGFGQRRLTPGTRLVRDWHGVGYTVTVLKDGFKYDGRHWTSLTAIAGAITGGHWNGPRFFGIPAPAKR